VYPQRQVARTCGHRGLQAFDQRGIRHNTRPCATRRPGDVP
jgi:hypothetical protein